jgi:hypothetical protein
MVNMIILTTLVFTWLVLWWAVFKIASLTKPKGPKFHIGSQNDVRDDNGHAPSPHAHNDL